MLLSVKRIEELNKLIAIEQKKAVDNKSRKNRLKELQSFEKTIVTSINHFLLDAGLVRSLLQLGTALRRGSEELSRHSSAIFRTLGKLFEKRCEISDFRYVIFGLAEANKFVEFSTLGNSLVWHDEKQKIVDFLFDVREILDRKIKKIQKIYQNEIAILSLGSQLSSSFWYKVEVLNQYSKK